MSDDGEHFGVDLLQLPTEELIHTGQVETIYSVVGRPDVVIRRTHDDSPFRGLFNQEFLSEQKALYEDMRSFGIDIPRFDYFVVEEEGERRRYTIAERVSGVPLVTALSELQIESNKSDDFTVAWARYYAAKIATGKLAFSDPSVINFMYGKTVTNPEPRTYLVDIDPHTFGDNRYAMRDQVRTLVGTVAIFYPTSEETQGFLMQAASIV
jgi:hypothetical protein